MKIKCKNCNGQLRAKPRRTYKFWISGKKFPFKTRSIAKDIEWIEAYCDECGETTRVRSEFIQPSEPLFKEIYGYDPFSDTAKEEIRLRQEEDERKIELEKKYHHMFRGDGINKYTRSQAEKDIKKEVKK